MGTVFLVPIFFVFDKKYKELKKYKIRFIKNIEWCIMFLTQLKNHAINAINKKKKLIKVCVEMSKTLIITEKPSVGRDIARVLSCKSKADGYLYNDEYIISWAVGHLVTLFDPEDYDASLKKWQQNTLPIIPSEIKLKPIKTTQKQLKILKQLMKTEEVTDLICATDSGREGELIFRYIYDINKCKKPFKRLWISSMTDTAIKKGFANLKDGTFYDNLFESARCRSEADWIVGINATRAYTIRYNALLTIGRVQTPTLAVLVERQIEINNFNPQEYFEVTADFSEYSGTWFDIKTNETKIFEMQKADEIIAKCKNQIGKIKSVENEEKRQPHPFLYDLTELQRDCNRNFGYSAQDTLKVAQDLYEKRKLITYPRTDSRFLSDDMIPQIKTTLTKIKNLAEYKPYVEYIEKLEKLPITKRIVDNSKITDHHAIIPTDVNINLSSLSEREFKVYNLIVQRFLCIFYPPYIYNITKITTEVTDENFLSKGTTIIQLGWKELYKKSVQEEIEKAKKAKKKKGEEEEKELPNVSENEEFPVKDIKKEKKKTTPPKTYTEATLLSAMENAGRFVDDEDLKEQLKNSGIGTPATRASIIERLIAIKYVERKGRSLIPTEKGMKLIEIVPNELKSPATTGKWEKGLNSIASGKMKHERFMESISRYVNFLVNHAKTTSTNVTFPEEQYKGKKGASKYLGKCPTCENGNILENTKAFFCTNWKNGCKFTIWKSAISQYGVEVDNKLIKELLKNKIIKNINYTLPQTQEKMVGELIYNKDIKAQLEFINSNRIETADASVGQIAENESAIAPQEEV